MQCDSYTLLSYLQRSSLTACLIDAARMLQMTLPWCSCVVTERALSPSHAKKNAHAEGTDSHRRLTQNAKAHTKGKGSHRSQRLPQKAKACTKGKSPYRRLTQKAQAPTEGKGLHRKQRPAQKAKAPTGGKGTHRRQRPTQDCIGSGQGSHKSPVSEVQRPAGQTCSPCQSYTAG